MLTEDQIKQIVAAICPGLNVPNIGWPNPFRFEIGARGVPESIVEEIEDGMGTFRLAGLPGGPFGKDIRGAFIEIALDQRGCVYNVSIVGGVKEGESATRRRVTRSTGWKAL